MLYDNVMVPFDGSEPAQAALAEAVRFAREDPGLTLHIVQIADLGQRAIERMSEQGADLADGAMPAGMREAVEAETTAATEQLHRQIDPIVGKLMNEVIVRILEESHPGSQIIAYAQEHHCDLIAMGSRGLGAVRGILGSVSSYVLREAPVPVLVVKDAAE